MAQPNSELLSKLQKRRSKGEEVYERAAGTSQADACFAMAAPAATPQPPEQVDVHSASFEAALERIREFERRVSQTQQGGSAGPGRVSRVAAETAEPAAKVAGTEGANAKEEDCTIGSQTHPTDRREGVKLSVKERFLQLLQEGMDTNAAAARAILEAAKQADAPEAATPAVTVPASSDPAQAQEQEKNKETAFGSGRSVSPGARSSGSSGSVKSTATRTSCASDVRGGAKNVKKKAISVY
eukprot:CAMPEP_0178389362 /NCGR_PEP_ID=MMETSP0689_2-20121128/10077_1 /TAXON_ID=160604 /ORGANISM="Amphidinium massartii, Strain CS-259" /LENGTH=240 /DNA_ID=CAMNT_0020009809 /DNA_START=75 /DNA_END=797 /DNA_ORIENTATION=-